MTTKDQVAQLIVGEAKARNHTRDECLAEMSALYQEAEFDETAWGPAGKKITYGVAQQDGSYPNRFQGAAAQLKAFFDKLDVKRVSPGHGDIWLNICWLQQAPNYKSAQEWWDKGRRAYLDEIKSRIATVTPYLDKYWPTGGSVSDNRPAFNEFPLWSPNSQSRGGTKVDLFLLHTQEGGGGNSAAEDLANFLADPNSGVSYHYTISQADDSGVTVVDCVDTDEASWSVLSANNRSINLCFAGSKASWTRDQWMQQKNAIDVAAYLAVQDCKKYGIPFTVIGTGGVYSSARAGVSDHQYVTKVLGDGTHTDVGGGFPVDYFTERFNYWASDQPTVPPVVQPPAFQHPSNDQMLKDIWDQLRGPEGKGWTQLGKDEKGNNRTVVDALANLLSDK